ADGSFAPKVLPSFRPDPAVNLHKAGFADYLRKLEETVGREISTVEDVRQALSVRIAFFDAHGCRSADHGLDYVMFRPASDMAATAALRKARAGEPLTREEAEGYQTALLLHCAREYARLGWVMQLHFSCMRNPNTKILKTLGPDTGFDCMAVTDSCSATYRLLDTLEQEASLPRTVLYSLNPADNAWIDTLLGAFQSPEIPGKIQHGSAWWFNDHKAGMTEHLTSLANLGVLGNFIGMLTDSRSLLSYARHEYFRRVLCDLLGRWVENGEYPRDMETLGGLVQDICCHNAKRYFNL
ncbi:MAG: glucuronate isomerase, partial [Flavonifractor plautii]